MSRVWIWFTFNLLKTYWVCFKRRTLSLTHFKHRTFSLTHASEPCGQSLSDFEGWRCSDQALHPELPVLLQRWCPQRCRYPPWLIPTLCFLWTPQLSLLRSNLKWESSDSKKKIFQTYMHFLLCLSCRGRNPQKPTVLHQTTGYCNQYEQRDATLSAIPTLLQVWRLSKNISQFLLYSSSFLSSVCESKSIRQRGEIFGDR